MTREVVRLLRDRGGDVDVVYLDERPAGVLIARVRFETRSSSSAENRVA